MALPRGEERRRSTGAGRAGSPGRVLRRGARTRAPRWTRTPGHRERQRRAPGRAGAPGGPAASCKGEGRDAVSRAPGRAGLPGRHPERAASGAKKSAEEDKVTIPLRRDGRE